MAEAICLSCAADKELPLGRCGACGHVPRGEEQELALVCSTRVLTAEQLTAVAERVRKGEPVLPSAALREQARAILRGAPRVEAVTLSRGQMLALTLGNVLLTPLLGYAVWFTMRRRPGPAGRQALIATLPISLALAVAWGIALRT